MKIILLGGSGLLGTELQKLLAGISSIEVVAPCHHEIDIARDLSYLNGYVFDHKPDIIINAAAEIDNRKIEKYPERALRTNVIGASNVAISAYQLGARLVYISTDYIYKGDRGNYKETDEILPFNLYAWLKLGGECATRIVENHLIIRTSFGRGFDYPVAFFDKYTSKDNVETIARMILDAALSPLTGILNLGTKRKSIYSYACDQTTRDKIEKIRLADTSHNTPRDTSFDLQKWIDYTYFEQGDATTHDHCRVCNSKDMVKYFDLGLMPLANNLEFTSERARNQELFPLQVLFCRCCGCSQLSVVINSKKMFTYYTYRSGVNRGYVEHCERFAKDLISKGQLRPNSYVIDIAGNDGTLLKTFRDVAKQEFNDEVNMLNKDEINVLNVDPATNLTAIAEMNEVTSLADFWSESLARNIVGENGRRADVITATNVFAHVDNVIDFLNGCKYALAETGVIILEFPYLADLIKNKEFDTIYFEHLSYYLLTPLIELCEKTGLIVIDVERQAIHGGSIRVSITHANDTPIIKENVMEFIENEQRDQLDVVRTYIDWGVSVKAQIENFTANIMRLKHAGKKIACFGASAKGNTLLNAAKMNTDVIDYIADETPEKIGKFSPKTAIPIVNKQELINNPPDVLIILAWNFKEEIMKKLEKIYNGDIVIPIPEFELISSDSHNYDCEFLAPQYLPTYPQT